MNFSRKGKIARLPRSVREELNRRLSDGEAGKKLVDWLNGLPEVRAVVAAEFGGKFIREQNLSEWKGGGYRDWLGQQDALELAARLREQSAELEGDDGPPLTDTLASWVATRYAMAIRGVAEAEGPESWRLLREFCSDLVELRRGDHSAQRIILERERAAAINRDADFKWKRKVIVGLEALIAFAKNNPKAQAALDQLTELVRHPFDPTENEEASH